MVPNKTDIKGGQQVCRTRRVAPFNFTSSDQDFAILEVCARPAQIHPHIPGRAFKKRCTESGTLGKKAGGITNRHPMENDAYLCETRDVPAAAK